MSEEVEKKEKKLQSRKFLVWFVWLILSMITLSISIVTMIVTKSFPETVVDLLKAVLQYFFYVSALYLGVNGIQKVGFAISDALSSREEKDA